MIYTSGNNLINFPDFPSHVGQFCITFWLSVMFVLMVIPLRLKQDMHTLGGAVWKLSQHDREARSKLLLPIHQKHHVF